jgi:hypothetical protein
VVWAWADAPRTVANSAAPDAKRRTLVCNLTSPVAPGARNEKRDGLFFFHWLSRRASSTFDALYNLFSNIRSGIFAE